MENTALTLYKAGRKDEARALLEKMRGMNRQAARRASFSEAFILVDENQYAAAVKILEPLLPQSEDDRTLSRAEILRLYAKSLEKTDRPVDAYNAWNELRTLVPGDLDAVKAVKNLRHFTVNKPSRPKVLKHKH